MIGLGFGGAVHVPGWQRVSGVEVVGVAGRRRDAAIQAASRLGVPHGVEGIDELLALDIDIVSLALPPSINEAVVHSLLDRDIPFLCEKPIALSAATAEDIGMIAAQRRLPTAVDFEFLELDTFRALQEGLADSVLGTVRDIEIVWLSQSWALGRGEPSWKLRRSQGGGVLAMLGSHLLFMIESMFGCFELISAEGSNHAAKTVVGHDAALDSINFEGRTESGVRISARISNSVINNRTHRWTIIGDDGTAVIENQTDDPVQGFKLIVNSASGHTVVEEPQVAKGDGRLHPFIRLAGRYVAAARTGLAFQPSTREGARVEQLMETIEAACSRE